MQFIAIAALAVTALASAVSSSGRKSSASLGVRYHVDCPSTSDYDAFMECYNNQAGRCDQYTDEIGCLGVEYLHVELILPKLEVKAHTSSWCHALRIGDLEEWPAGSVPCQVLA
ncbi:Uu.00g105540.m01.CDS01 [Anthostomella pinea]|uniref:Uu.00g105540.m01.CDS01 n=1 Tax=Anthostomella pinea TaxID=933095 RepID=A0AAI8VE18_9PEZI|nr:Uu.00g105540.m01.CDS01 [Anthostomella pinea]